MKLFFAVLFFSLVTWAQNAPKEMTIGFIPGGDREVLKKGALILAKELQQQVGVPINVFIPKNYSSLIEALKEKKVDFAFLTSASYVDTEKHVPVQVLLKKVWAEPFYFSVLIVRKDSKLRKLEDLKNKKIAFVDEKSTSGYLYPQVMLRKRGWGQGFFKDVVFSGSHLQSVNLLERKDVDAIAVFSDDKEGSRSAWAKYGKQKDKDVRVLWVSDPIPNDPFCVRQEFYDQYPKLVHTLMFTLIDAAEKLRSKKEVVEVIGGRAFMPATSRQYDPVREMVKALNLKVE